MNRPKLYAEVAKPVSNDPPGVGIESSTDL